MKNLTLKILTIFIIVLFINSYSFAIYIPENTAYVWSENTSNSIEVSADNTNSDFLELKAESAILIEQNTGKILYDKNSHEQLRPASVTKIMSLLLIMEALDSGKISLEDKVSCSDKASAMGGSQIWLDQTETLSVDEMLKAICVVSANDCCVAMAEFIAGSETAFVEKMNERAKELGMNDTCFKNCHGIDEDGHLTSSYDISLMSRELLKNHPSITNYTTIWTDTLRDGKSELVNTNKLIRTYDGATGLKTGSTSLALYNLSASATRNNLSLIAVVMRAPTPTARVSNAKALLDYGFANYEYLPTSEKDTVLETIKVEKGIPENVDLAYETSTGAIIKKGSSSEITSEIIKNENICAPINENDVLGKVNFYLDNELVSTCNLIAKNSVNKMNIFNIFGFTLNNWFSLLRT